LTFPATETSTNALFNDNAFKLGLFGLNSVGCAHTLVPEAYSVTWAESVEIAQKADRAGFEALVPYSRWKGYLSDDPHHRSNLCYECWAWAAATAAVTSYSTIFSTSLVPSIEPLLAAKLGATIDQISNGRFALNILAGWSEEEMRMFGQEMKEHDTRYEQATEWFDLILKCWSESEYFDYEGEFYRAQGVVSQPKPLQTRPAIMNAGGSERGMAFAAKYADLAFVVLQHDDQAEVKSLVDRYKRQAENDYGRRLQVWAHCYVVQGDTQEEAERYESYYVDDHGDYACADAFIEGIGGKGVMSKEDWQPLHRRFRGGAGGYPLVGSAESIAERLTKLSAAGLDGVLLSWVDFNEGIDRWTEGVMPLLESAGIRRRRT
jgi:FMNH2-dependent dimethyl sulfone monooxygenase